MPYGVAVDNNANWNAAKAVITITNIFISDTATGYAFTAAVTVTGRFGNDNLPMFIK